MKATLNMDRTRGISRVPSRAAQTRLAPRVHVILAALALLSCLAAAQTTGFADRDPQYKLQAEDKVEVQYRYTPEYNATAALQPDGYVSLPFVGQVKLAGLTLDQASKAIAARAADRLADPEVTVLLREYVKPYFVVAGEVAHPGRFELHGQVSLIEALALSGGLKESSKRTQVILMRKRDEETAQVRLLDVRKLMSPSSINEDISIRSGDMIVVPRNWVSRVEPLMRLAESPLTIAMWGIK
ncbi:MAG: polysaccharide biosynthesis/export family protein [Bryobacteraceae bacterium]|jgi:polysaccharide export outer membrane protein